MIGVGMASLGLRGAVSSPPRKHRAARVGNLSG